MATPRRIHRSSVFACILSTLALSTLAGCNGRLGGGRRSTVPEYLVTVDGLRDASATDQASYVLMPGVAGVGPTDLLYREFAEQVHRALATKGFTRAPSAAQAQVAVFVGYGLGPSQVSYDLVNHPTHGLHVPAALPTVADGTPAMAELPNADGTTPAAGNTSAPAAPAAASVTTPPALDPAPAVAAAPSLPPPPRASSAPRGRHSEYARYLRLSAIDVPRYLATGELFEVWRVTVTSTGATSDLRIVVPVLVAAARNAIASDTGTAQPLWIRDNDPRVEFVRGVR